MRKPSNTIDGIRADLQSASVNIRREALQSLSELVRGNRHFAAEAAPIFRHAWRHETDPFTVLTAARGIELAEGDTQGRAALMDLLDRPQQDLVATAVLNAELDLTTEHVLALYARATDPGLRRTLINALGRKHDRAAFDVLAAAIDDPELRPWAIEALVAVGDPAAIPHIEPCLSDTADAWAVDNHGPMMRVCDVASDAIAALRKSSARPHVPERAAAPNARASTASAGAPFGYPGPPMPVAPPQGTFFALAPLAAAVLSVPWFLMVVLSMIDISGRGQGPRSDPRSMDLVAIIPPAIGISVGLFGLAKRRIRGTWRYATLTVGCLLCAIIATPFLIEARSATALEEQQRAANPPPPPPVRVPIPSGKPPQIEVRQPFTTRPAGE